MSRGARYRLGGMVYHVLNRGVGRRTLFDKDQDFFAFERVVEEWSSLRRGERDDPAFPILSEWPLPRPTDWLEIVNRAQSEAELNALRRCVRRGCPLGTADWAAETAKRLRIESTLRTRGRPKKED